jgi:hypothetical protein
MICAVPQASSIQRDDAVEIESGESCTRPIAQQANDDSELLRGDSQRPTLPVPATSSLVAYKESPPRIQHMAVDVGARLVFPELASLASPEANLKAPTRRLRLTYYAREHALRDGDTEDTPAALLEYLRVLGSVERVPYVTATRETILLAKLDHHEGFVLSLVDGQSDIDTLLDASPMPTHKTLRILQGLRVRRLIAVRDPALPRSLILDVCAPRIGDF